MYMYYIFRTQILEVLCDLVNITCKNTTSAPSFHKRVDLHIGPFRSITISTEGFDNILAQGTHIVLKVVQKMADLILTTPSLTCCEQRMRALGFVLGFLIGAQI